jgi:macrocin-O-methyltransferase TylF-like protien
VVLARFNPEGGHCFVCQLPDDLPPGDSMDESVRSALQLFEDGYGFGIAHSEHDAIRTRGGGRYSHWRNLLYFSTRDNTDPRRNRRTYTAYVPAFSRREVRLSNIVGDLGDATAPADAYTVAESLFYEAFPAGFIGEFGKACWHDEAFVRDYLRLVHGNRRSFERKFVVHQLALATGGIEGDMVECGVYNGATAFFMAQAARRLGVERPLHLFDSFEGLSNPGDCDGVFWHAGALAVSESAARDNLAWYDEARIYRGWIPQRFREVADRCFSFVHIDVDLYQPTLDSVAFFYPRTTPGGIIVCDDYGFVTCPGATRAMDEYMADKPEHVVHLPTGQGVVMRGSGDAGQ